jgi:hypothetical protein
MTNRAPLIVAIVLLLLPVLYVGSYLALVRAVRDGNAYSFRCHPALRPLFSPLYRLDIELRPDAWWFHEQIDGTKPAGP